MRKSSYKQIAKSTSIFGGSQLAVILIGMVRTKVLAILLGTTGVGLIGLFQSIIELIRSASSLGLSFSSVKEIAEANNAGEEEKIVRTVTVLRRLVWWTGLTGMLMMMAFSSPISVYAFGDKSKAWPICLLSFCVFSGIVSSGQSALLQGMRRIKEMAKVSLFGAFGGSVLAIILYFFLGIEGIVPSLMGISIVGLSFSWWYARQLQIKKVSMTLKEVLHRGREMLILGLYTVAAGFISTLFLFLIKSFILKSGGVQEVGLFQSVWSISNMYIGAILTAMAADYFPRLCGYNDSRSEMVRFSNEQTRFVLIVTTPLIVGMLLFASPVLNLLYSSRFVLATDLLRWQITGSFLKVFIWPLGFILLAKGKGQMFFMVEAVWYIVYYVTARFLWPYLGLNALGVAYLFAYLVYVFLVYFTIKPLCSFKYEPRNLYIIMVGASLVMTAFFVAKYLNSFCFYGVGSLVFLGSMLFSGYEINKIIPWKTWMLKLKLWRKH